jgi:GNAT superfamily N-acetyltransferase
LQERAARALPARRVVDADGWWLRVAPRCAWWVGSVLPHGAGDLAGRVAQAEAFYAGLGARWPGRGGAWTDERSEEGRRRQAAARPPCAGTLGVRFQISPTACPPELDALLAARGYRRESPMSLRVASTADVLAGLPAGAPGRVVVDDRPTREWFDAWYAVHGHGIDPRAEWDMLERVRQPAGYARVLADGDVVAVGRAVADTGWAGVFGMATLPGARGKGAARRVLAALAGWAGDQHADRLYLQVERDNTPALRLYGRAAFTEMCGYHYRVR